MSHISKDCPVSIILPFHNAGDTIIRSVESILHQTRLPAQIVCINDGSDDGSLKILQDFVDGHAEKNRFTIIDMKENGGVYVARNKGLDAAVQPYLSFLDADDFWHPKKLEIQFIAIENDPRICLSCHRVDIWPDGEATSFPEENVDIRKISSVSSQLSLWVTRLHTVSIIMKNVPQYRFDENMRRGGDMLMWLEVVLSNDWAIFHDQTLAWKAKEHFGAGGLSGNLWKAEMANQYSINSLANKGLISRPYSKVLRAWCMIKLCRRYIIVGMRRVLNVFSSK